MMGKPLSASTSATTSAIGSLSTSTPSQSKINRSILAPNAGQLRQFHDAGGWLVLHDLTPEGLADYNRIVGFDHMIRPFRRERVTIACPRSRLLAGVSLGDVALYSSEGIFPWQAGNFVASDTSLCRGPARTWLRSARWTATPGTT